MGDIDTLVLHPNSGYRAGVAVENVHAKGTRRKKVLKVCLCLQSSQVEHLFAVESDKLEGALHVDVPFERVLRERQSVHLRWSEHFRNARLNSGRPWWVELDDLGDEVLVVLVLGEGEWLVSELGHTWSCSDVDQEGNVGTGALLENRTVALLVQAVVYCHLQLTLSRYFIWKSKYFSTIASFQYFLHLHSQRQSLSEIDGDTQMDAVQVNPAVSLLGLIINQCEP